MVYPLSEEVKPKRRYRSQRREMQAQATQAAVIDAARELFVVNGWSATTIAGIARRAGVSQETIYARFGNKREIVRAMVATAMRGARPDVPFMEQAERQVIQTTTDPTMMVDRFCADVCSVLARVAPIMAVVRSAAETDPEMAGLYAQLHAARRENLLRFVVALKKAGGLRACPDEQIAVDQVWSLASPEIFTLWTGAGGRTPDDHREWISGALQRLLLAEE